MTSQSPPPREGASPERHRCHRRESEGAQVPSGFNQDVPQHPTQLSFSVISK